MLNCNMKQWIDSLKGTEGKKSMPILSFPCVSLLGVTVRELISDSALQAKGMKAIADRSDSAASVSFMDLSVEAECFGATVSFSDDEVPTVKGKLINDMDEAEALTPFPLDRYAFSGCSKLVDIKLPDSLQELGSAEIKGGGKRGIHCISIIGQVEGHQVLPENAKTTKYEHILPLLAGIEESEEIDGLLLLLMDVLRWILNLLWTVRPVQI